MNKALAVNLILLEALSKMLERLEARNQNSDGVYTPSLELVKAEATLAKFRAVAEPEPSAPNRLPSLATN